MAITKNAKRAIGVSERKRVSNDKRRRNLKETVKTVRKNVSTNAKTLKDDLTQAFKALDKAAKRGTIKKGNADRKKSRLAKAVAKVSVK